MDKRDEAFRPETVDERIEHIRWNQQQVANSAQDARLVHDLHHFYHEYADTHERVWNRLAQHMTDHSPAQQNDTGIIQLKRHRQQQKGYHPMKQESLYPKLTVGLGIAAAVAILLVGSMAWLFTQAHFSHTTTTTYTTTASNATQKPLSGVYVATSTTVESVDLQHGEVLWSSTILKPNGPGMTRIARIIPDGKSLYIAVVSLSTHSPSRIIALDAGNGSIIWQYQFSNMRVNAEDLAVANGKVYSTVTTTTGQNQQSGFLYIFDAASGKQEARYTIPAAVNALTIADNTLYISASNGLYAFDAVSIKQLWYTAINSDGQNATLFITTPHVVNSTLYTVLVNDTETSSTYSYIAAFNAKNGVREWQSPRIAEQVFDITVANNAVYFGSLSGTLYAYDAQQGRQLWSVATPGAIEWAPAVANGVVYASDYISILPQTQDAQEQIVAASASDGHMLWQENVNNGLLTTPYVVNDMLYVASGFNTGTIYALKTADGTQAWQTPLSDEPQFLTVVQQ